MASKLLDIKIPGLPIAKARPRFFKRGNFVGTYNSQETEEGRTMLFIKDSYNGPLIDFPVKVSMIFGFPRPKAHFGTGRNKDKLKPSAPTHCTNAKDVDNLAKFYMDCMNGLVWQDDKYVVELLARKVWVMEPYTLITIEEATNEDKL